MSGRSAAIGRGEIGTVLPSKKETMATRTSQMRRISHFLALLGLLLVLFDAAEAFVVERRARRPSRLFRFVPNNRRTTRRSESLVVRLRAEKKKKVEQDAEDGWGFDVDDQLMDQAEKELKNESSTLRATRDQERDLFIPIFALVSIIGFGGLYAYEILRLYFAGELYLPFLH